MAKARYAMGHHAVGALQYDAVMTPLVHVETSNELALFDETDSNLEFRVERLQLGRKESPEGTDSSGTELRRRRPGSGGQSSVEDVPVQRESESVMEVKDPLKWFGILVPQSLRHSQQYFIQGMLTVTPQDSRQLVLCTPGCKKKNSTVHTKEKWTKTIAPWGPSCIH